MVSKDFIQKMLEWLAGLYDKRIDDKIINSYYFRLKPYDEEIIRKIVFRWTDSASVFPKIADILAQIPKSDSLNEADYRIEYHMMCQECHSPDVMCIKEPKGSGIWRCRECYTGLNADQVRKRFEDLGVMMGDKEFKPDWVKELDKKYGQSKQG
jgi:ribosomal protein L37AE/L43A